MTMTPLRRWVDRAPTGLGVIASLIAIVGAGIGLFEALGTSDGHASSATEAKQIVSFHQLANRICIENQRDLEQALPEARSEVQLLAFLSRGTGWGINDLEGVTAATALAAAFAEELAIRGRLKQALLEVQRAGETGELPGKAEAIELIASLEERATELDRELRLRRCAPVLPHDVKEEIGVD
jgi:hypothetical protein